MTERLGQSVGSFDGVLKAVYSDPKFVAVVEWMRDYSINAQLFGQVPRREFEHYTHTGKHINLDREVSIELHEMPDFDWWEPRYDQPWRRRQAHVEAARRKAGRR